MNDLEGCQHNITDGSGWCGSCGSRIFTGQSQIDNESKNTYEKIYQLTQENKELKERLVYFKQNLEDILHVQTFKAIDKISEVLKDLKIESIEEFGEDL